MMSFCSFFLSNLLFLSILEGGVNMPALLFLVSFSSHLFSPIPYAGASDVNRISEQEWRSPRRRAPLIYVDCSATTPWFWAPTVISLESLRSPLALAEGRQRLWVSLQDLKVSLFPYAIGWLSPRFLDLFQYNMPLALYMKQVPLLFHVGADLISDLVGSNANNT